VTADPAELLTRAATKVRASRAYRRDGGAAAVARCEADAIALAEQALTILRSKEPTP
jgi:hypothetical protein